MATKKTTTKKSSSSSSSSKRTVWGLNKISFWTIVAVTFLYAVSLVLAACNVNLKVVSALQGVATHHCCDLSMALCKTKANGLESALCYLPFDRNCRYHRSTCNLTCLQE